MRQGIDTKSNEEGHVYKCLQLLKKIGVYYFLKITNKFIENIVEIMNALQNTIKTQ